MPSSVAVAFTTITVRAGSVGHEVLALLRAGFPEGAHARWRTLYELAVFSEVLRQGNRGTASRYVNHRYVLLNREPAQVLATGEEGDHARREVAREAGRFIRRYGKSFRGRYGWAAELTHRRLGVPSPQFSDLEELADLDRFGMLHQLAHHRVHGGVIGAALLSDGLGRLHHGASPEGLGVIAAATIDCLAAIAETAALTWETYRSRRDPWLESVRFMSEELALLGVRNAWLTIPDYDALAHHFQRE